MFRTKVSRKESLTSSEAIFKKNALPKIETLLEPYLYLDKSKSDGKDLYFKLSNFGLGVSPDDIKFLNELSQECSKWNLTDEELCKVVDVLVLYSNHLDQHVNDRQNPKLEQSSKNYLVLNWLQHAFNLFPAQPENTKENARILSSYAQLLHYYGKALRYGSCHIDKRLTFLLDAVARSEFLDALKLSESLDPHQYEARKRTYQLPVMYCYLEPGKENRLDDALNIAKEHRASIKKSSDGFDEIQSDIQLARICCKMGNPEEGIIYAKEANDLATQHNSRLSFNVKQSLMECHWHAGHTEEAVELAHQIIVAVRENPNCGAKDIQLKAAENIMTQYSNLPSAMSL